MMTEEQLIAMDERIDNYLRGKMSGDEEKQFLSDCRNDPDLRERAYMTALLAKALKQ